MTPELMPKNFGKDENCIVIMLGDTNLDIIKGYKAEVTKNLSILHSKDHASINITITGLSNKGADYLFESLNPLPPEELTELLKRKGFHFTLQGASHE